MKRWSYFSRIYSSKAPGTLLCLQFALTPLKHKINSCNWIYPPQERGWVLRRRLFRRNDGKMRNTTKMRRRNSVIRQRKNNKDHHLEMVITLLWHAIVIERDNLPLFSDWQERRGNEETQTLLAGTILRTNSLIYSQLYSLHLTTLRLEIVRNEEITSFYEEREW